MSKRPRLSWIAFWVSLVLVACGLAWCLDKALDSVIEIHAEKHNTEITSTEYDRVTRLIEHEPIIGGEVKKAFDNDGIIDKFEYAMIERIYEKVHQAVLRKRLLEGMRAQEETN